MLAQIGNALSGAGSDSDPGKGAILFNQSFMTISQRYGDALLWAEQLHRDQRRKGKPVPYISHLISVSALVWEDGGNEDQAIAGLLHDAIEDARQDHSSIAGRFGTDVADIVVACTDTGGPVVEGAVKEPWLVRKTRTIETMASKPAAAWLVIAADKAHNARDLMIDSRRDPSSWNRFRQGADGMCWYLSSGAYQQRSPLGVLLSAPLYEPTP